MKHSLVANISANEFCNHCEQVAMVLLDDVRAHSTGFAVPCPMCQRGAKLDLIQWNGAFWKTHRNAEAVSWAGGLTVQHRRLCSHKSPRMEWPCHRPTRGSWCAFHDDVSNRQPGAWQRGSAEFGAVLAGFSFGVMPEGDSDDELVAVDVERGRFVRGQREARESLAVDSAAAWDGVPT